MPKPLTVWITTNCGKFWKRWKYQTTLPTSGEIYMLVKKQVRTGHGTTDWFHIGKGVQDCILLSDISPWPFKNLGLYNMYVATLPTPSPQPFHTAEGPENKRLQVGCSHTLEMPEFLKVQVQFLVLVLTSWLHDLIFHTPPDAGRHSKHFVSHKLTNILTRLAHAVR